ncbi:MAG: glycosyltransferase [Clostridiales bacterium]|jgi:glycosyltransferase involved in cell wall biosynthesis|nr:glycosyltransferase [Clostridiales bacterium]
MRVCVIAFCKGHFSDFKKTLDSIGAAGGKPEETFVLCVFHGRRSVDLEPDVSLCFERPGALNIKSSFSADSRAAREIERYINEQECEVVFPIFEGDAVDARYIEYIQYFFEENSRCDSLITPVVMEGTPETYSRPPQNAGFDPDGAWPLITEGFALRASAVLGRLDAGMGVWALTCALYKAAMRKGRGGALNTVRYIAAGRREAPLPVICGIAREIVDRYQTLPRFLAEPLYERLRNTPAADKEINKDALYLCGLKNLVSPTVSRSIEITRVHNYYTQTSIEGVFSPQLYRTGPLAEEDVQALLRGENTPQLGVITDVEIFDWNIAAENTTATAADRLWPRVHFSFRVQPADGCFTISFESEGRPLSISCAEHIGNYEILTDETSVTIHKTAPRAYYEVSVIIPVYNGEKYLKESVNSVLTQTLDFFSHIHVILINDGSTDASGSICEALSGMYPYNVTYIAQAHQGVSAARNAGLRVAAGRYAAFLDADDILPPDFLETGVEFLDKNPDLNMAAFPIQYFGGDQEASLNFRFKRTGAADINNSYDYIQFSTQSTITRKNALSGMQFDRRLKYAEDAEFMHRLLLKDMKYGIITAPAYQYRLHGGSVTAGKLYDPEWYGHTAVFAKAVIERSIALAGKVTEYTQYLLIHELKDSITPMEFSGIVPIGDLDAIFEKIRDALQYVRDDIIINARTLPYWFRLYLLKLKHERVTLRTKGRKAGFYAGGFFFKKLTADVYIFSITERNGSLRFRGFYNLPLYDGIFLGVECEKREYRTKERENSSPGFDFLRRSAHRAHSFSVSIPAAEKTEISFFLCGETDGGRWPVNLQIANNAPGLPFVTGGIILKSQDNILHAAPLTASNVAEAAANLNNPPVLAAYCKMAPLFTKTRIWLFMDQPDAAGSNAEYLFNYCAGKADGIRKYFVIKPDTLDGLRVSEAGAVIGYGSDTHKLLYLFSEKIIVSDIENGAYNPFTAAEYNVVRSFAHAELVYLPDDMPLNGLPSGIDIISHNIGGIAVSCETELNAVKWFDDSVIHVTGRPKHDKLNDSTQPCVLLMPDYRPELFLGELEMNMGFSDSEYCARINALLCDERLIEAAGAYGYEIIFVPHEKTILQLADFEMDESVTLAAGEYSSTRLFESAALLITDSMPVYDYVYMNKPVIYYNFADARPPETVFGEIIAEHDKLVESIIAYMAEGCLVREADARKVKAFFKHTDHNNCERVYSAMLNL